jgi:hypothetical protein
MSAAAHRYPDLTAVDSDGTTVHYDLCKPCATRWTADGKIDLIEMECPEVDYDEGYRCDRCDRRISLS